jgi:hypothetical protein
VFPDLAVTVFVRVVVVQRFTLTVRVEVGSVIVKLTCAIPKAIVSGLGVLGAAVSCLKSGLFIGPGSQCLRRGREKRIGYGTGRCHKRFDDGGSEVFLEDRRCTKIWTH